MKGDFTRITFDDGKHYSLVFGQQGRVQLDADANEMNIIHLAFYRRLAADLIGPHGGPGKSFLLTTPEDNGQKVPKDLEIGRGHYYVDGTLCEADSITRYSQQRGSPLPLQLEAGKSYLAYLDVWDRHVTAYEDEDEERIGIREVALRGPDTTSRAEIIWQVKWLPITAADITKLKDADPQKAYDNFRKFLGESDIVSGQLRARALKPRAADEPCLISPEGKYRGAENQLYRVEIHHPGTALKETDDASRVDQTTIATFKWSRENGSVIYPITDLQGEVATLRDLGRDSRFGLSPDDWVEIVDDDYALQNRAEPLLQVKEINRDNMQVTLKKAPVSSVGTDPAKHPLMRRWDQPSDGLMVVETLGDDDSDWIFTLEDGVQIQFNGVESLNAGPRVPAGAKATYRTGDYWLIPARVATADVDWPGPPGNPRSRTPLGISHSFAPLGIISGQAGNIVGLDTDLRRTWKSLAQ
jgi:Family of unknown function (DUF6519)